MNTVKPVGASIFTRKSVLYKMLETKSPFQNKSGRDKFGEWAVATRSFPLQPFGTHIVGLLLPDAILRDLRSWRPHSRAVQGLTAHGLLGEVYLPAQPVVAATDLRTRQGHASNPFAS